MGRRLEWWLAPPMGTALVGANYKGAIPSTKRLTVAAAPYTYRFGFFSAFYAAGAFMRSFSLTTSAETPAL